MGYLLGQHWLAVLTVLAIGLVVGLMTSPSGDGRGRFAGWVPWGAGAFGLALLLVLSKLVPGRLGYWLDTAVLLVGTYVVGCLLSGLWSGLNAFFPRALLTGAPLWRPAAVPAYGVPPGLVREPFSTWDAEHAPVPGTSTESLRSMESTTASATPSVAPSIPDVSTTIPAEPALATPGAPAPDQVDALGTRPQGRPAPEAQPPDDLTLIRGIGPRNAALLQGWGIWQFDQIARWTPAESDWVSRNVAFPGRVERERWVEQARLLAAGVMTEHALAIRAGTASAGDEPLSAEEAAGLERGLPVLAASVENERDYAGDRPIGLFAPLEGRVDDLKRISGIGQQNEARLHGLGIWHFAQIAAWTQENIRWVSSYLAFPGRIDREKWVEQARTLAAGGETDFSRRADRGDVPTSRDDGSHGRANVTVLPPQGSRGKPD
jgi:predicted flap endonuclease-1-like 5' DNA nuclease